MQGNRLLIKLKHREENRLLWKKKYGERILRKDLFLREKLLKKEKDFPGEIESSVDFLAD